MSVIEQGLVVNGEIFGNDAVIIKGVVKGSVFLPKGDLQVEQSGLVEGEIIANTVMIAGEIRGNIVAVSRLQVASTAKITGDIQTPTIIMADGAFFCGMLDTRESEPFEKDIEDFSALTEQDYESLRRWRRRKNVK
jgi:cytoskeletal protein CcmA (bactofilin family)